MTLQYLDDEQERKNFPLVDKYYAADGHSWTPRELSDVDLDREIDHCNYLMERKQRTPRGTEERLKAHVQEKMRRELRRNAGVDPNIGQQARIKEVRRAILEEQAVKDKTENLIVEVRNESGEIYGRTVLKTHRFKTGSTGMKAVDTYRDPKTFAKLQFACQLVNCNSKPKSTD